MNFYLASGIGKIELDDDVYYAISLNSPIGLLLKNKMVNDNFEFTFITSDSTYSAKNVTEEATSFKDYLKFKNSDCVCV